MLKNKLFIIALLFFSNTPIQAEEKSNISLKDVWISEAPPTVSVLAAYAQIHNSSEKASKLVEVTGPEFTNVELHLSKVVNETATMEKQDSLTIPANSMIDLAPGSYHLMLFEPKKVFKAGDSTTLDFRFKDGRTISVSATVKKRNNQHNHNHHHHH